MNALFPMDFETRLLIVDDDAGMRELVSGFLEQHGYRVAVANGGAEMRDALANAAFDLVVMDVMMPGEDGLTILRSMGASDRPPVILMSVMGSDIDRIVGLEMGADDYLAKPFNPRELLARIRAVLRRKEAPDPAPQAAHASLFRFDHCVLDPMARELRTETGDKIALTDGEFRLLLALVERPRRVLSRDQLIELSRGSDTDSYDRAIDVQMSRLRRKLPGGGQGELIRTVRNEGYVLDADVRRG